MLPSYAHRCSGVVDSFEGAPVGADLVGIYSVRACVLHVLERVLLAVGETDLLLDLDKGELLSHAESVPGARESRGSSRRAQLRPAPTSMARRSSSR